MKILFSRPAPTAPGGAEVYLQQSLRELIALGIEVAVLTPPHSAPLPPEARAFEAPDFIVPKAAIQAWAPDLYISQGWPNLGQEREIVGAFPSVYLAHDFSGLCISGHKSWWFPSPTPCTRALGPGCLLHYFPHRCGGKNPLTLIQRYQSETQRVEHFKAFDGVVTLSQFMKRTFCDQGFDETKVHFVPFQPEVPPTAVPVKRDTVVVGYAGRLEERKGVMTFLKALPLLNLPNAAVHIAGTGDLDVWVDAQIRELTPQIRFRRFPWTDRPTLLNQIANWDVFAFPSQWPEPLGLAGMEAIQVGTPVAAFDVGGVSEWLDDGVHGVLAPAGDLSPQAFASAILGCLKLGRGTPPRSPTSHGQGLTQLVSKLSTDKT